MSKTREFWIYHNPEYDRGFPITVVSNEQQAMAPGTEEYHVIEKSAADKLAEALEQIQYDLGRYEWPVIQKNVNQALKEYRGEK